MECNCIRFDQATGKKVQYFEQVKRVEASDLRAKERHVMSCLLSNMDDAGECYPSLGNLAERTALSKSTVRRSIAALKSSGWLIESQRYQANGAQRSNLYTLGLPESVKAGSHYDSGGGVTVERSTQCKEGGNLIRGGVSECYPEKNSSEKNNICGSACAFRGDSQSVLLEEKSLKGTLASLASSTMQREPETAKTSTTNTSSTAPRPTRKKRVASSKPKAKAVTKKDPASPKAKRTTKTATDGSQVWQAYADAYWIRYNVEPVRNAKANSICKSIARNFGPELGAQAARYYLSHRKAHYVTQRHPLELLARDTQTILTDMQIGEQSTARHGQEQDRYQDAGQMVDRIVRKLALRDEKRAQQQRAQS